jgi:hypothetical protein
MWQKRVKEDFINTKNQIAILNRIGSLIVLYCTQKWRDNADSNVKLNHYWMNLYKN